MMKLFLRTLLSTVAIASSLSVAAHPANCEDVVSDKAPEANSDAESSSRFSKTSAAPRSDVRTSYGDKWAVVIGLDSYSDPSLNTVLPLDDSAKRVSDALATKGFARDHVRLLLNRDATKQAILSSLSSEWLGKLSRKSDLVVVFIATQCFPANDGKVYLIPYDTRLLNFFTSTITVDDIIQTIKDKVEAKDVVVVFQTSFSGTPEMMAGCKTMFGRYNISVHQSNLPDNFTVMCSSKPGQPTWGTYFSDNFAEDLSLNNKQDSLGELFNKVRNDTVYDTAKDCAGCKVQSPVLISKRNVHAIALGAHPENPVKNLPEEIALYLKGRVFIPGLKRFLTNIEPVAPGKKVGRTLRFFRLIETGHTTHTLSEEFRTKVDNTIIMVRDYLKENPKYAAGHYLLGRLLQFKQEHPAALDEFREAARLSPDQSTYHAWVARGLEENGQDSKAEWQKAYDLNNKSRSAIDSLVKNAVDDKNYERAVSLLNQAILLYPGDAILHVRLSDVLKQQGQIKLAVEQAQEAVFLDEHSIEALVNLGNLLMENKDEKAAHAAFREALELNSRQADYYFVLAQALEKTNDPEGAIQAWSRFVDGSDKDDKRLDDAKKRLNELKSF